MQERPTFDYALDPAEIGARVRSARAYANLTRQQLAEASGLQPGVIKRLESGIRLGTSGEELHRIAIACGVPPMFMVAGYTSGEDFVENAREAIRLLVEADLGAPGLRALAAFLDQRRAPASDADGQDPDDGPIRAVARS